MTSNGVGMGHISRQLATVLAAGQEVRAVVLSLSGALPRVAAAVARGELPEAEGLDVRWEYCPSWESPWLASPGRPALLGKAERALRWGPYLRERVVALVRETGARALVFDGVAAYPGLLQARRALPSVRFAWVRRGMWHPATPARRLDASRHFDLTLSPGDLAEAHDRGPAVGRQDAVRVPPVSLTSVLAPSDRAAARAALGLPAEGPVLLLSPGSGVLRPMDELVAEVLGRLRGTPWHVAVTRQAISRVRVPEADQVTVLDDVYPLARHLAAFDAAVGAAGYNSVHELLGSGVPSLFLPNPRSTTDDQVARAEGLAAEGLALVSDGHDLGARLAELLDEARRAELAAAMAGLAPLDGAARAAEAVLELARTGRPDASPLTTRTPPPWPLRLPPGGPLTSRLEPGAHRGSPVEHVLAGASAAYLESRERAAGWVFRR